MNRLEGTDRRTRFSGETDSNFPGKIRRPGGRGLAVEVESDRERKTEREP